MEKANILLPLLFSPIFLELTKDFNREGQQDRNKTFFSLGKQTENLHRVFVSCLITSPEQATTHQVTLSN